MSLKIKETQFDFHVECVGLKYSLFGRRAILLLSLYKYQLLKREAALPNGDGLQRKAASSI